jgi:hypothetical protein
MPPQHRGHLAVVNLETRNPGCYERAKGVYGCGGASLNRFSLACGAASARARIAARAGGKRVEKGGLEFILGRCMRPFAFSLLGATALVSLICGAQAADLPTQTPTSAFSAVLLRQRCGLFPSSRSGMPADMERRNALWDHRHRRRLPNPWRALQRRLSQRRRRADLEEQQ